MFYEMLFISKEIFIFPSDKSQDTSWARSQLPTGREGLVPGESSSKAPAKERTMDCSQPCDVSIQPTLSPPWFEGGAEQRL